MQRMQDRGQSVVVSLFMDSVLYPDSPSRNLLIDLVLVQNFRTNMVRLMTIQLVYSVSMVQVPYIDVLFSS